MLNTILYLILLVLGFPIGLLLAKVCKEEIKNWRKRLLIISGISFILSMVISFLNFEYKIPVIVALFFIIITDLTILWKSYGKRS